MEDIATALRLLREAKGIPQAELADLSGVDQNLLSMYEEGTLTPPRGTVVTLLAALGSDGSDLADVVTAASPLHQPQPGEADLPDPVTAPPARRAACRPSLVDHAITNALRFRSLRPATPATGDDGSSEEE